MLRRYWPVILAIVLVIFYYAWLASDGTFRFSRNAEDMALLNQQVEAFAKGRTYLDTTPAPQLLQLKDPYDPVYNRGYRLLDAVLYNRKYYTYFGPAPLVLFMWPYFALVGDHINAALLAFLLSAGALVLQAGVILRLAGFLQKVERPWLSGACILIVGTTNAFADMLVSHGTFEIPVLSGILFISAAFYFAARGSTSPSRQTLNFFVAALFIALACASRAALIPASCCFVSILLFLQWRHSRNVFRLCCILLPFIAVLISLGIYNDERFGSFFEFGNKFTLVEVDWRKTSAFSFSYVRPNAFYYLLSIPRLTIEFPYIIEPDRLPFAAPAGYIIGFVDRVWGMALFYPFYWMGNILALFCLWRGRHEAANGGLVLVWACAFLVAAVVLLFVGASVRYSAEFCFPLEISAAVGFMYSFSLPRRFITVFSKTAVGFSVVLTAGTVFLTAFLGYGGITATNPVLSRKIATRFNATVAAPLRVFLPIKIPVLKLVLPQGRSGKSEPLWVNGRPSEADFLYVYYSSPKTIQLGFESMGRGGPLSQPIEIDYAGTHKVEIIAPPFIPPKGDSYYQSVGISPDLPFDQILSVKIDGQLVFNVRVPFHDGKHIQFWGESPDEPAFGTKFTGTLSVGFEKLDPAMLIGCLSSPEKRRF